MMRRAARAVLTVAVRGRREHGGPWGEAALAEFDQTTGHWEAIRWTAGSLRAVWHEHRAKIQTLPTRVRLQRAMIVAVLLTIPAAVVINQFVLTPRLIPSGSMEPTILIQDRVLVDKVTFRLTGLSYGDIVEFTNPITGDNPLLKRVIGLPGDTIECREGKVYRDGAALAEPYLSPDGPTEDCGPPVTVPAGNLYVLGDHRLVSQDSRVWGTIPETKIDGRMLTRIWPLP